LLTGAGTKTKLIQALTVGTPTVSTTIGTEGLGLCHGQETLIADTASDFARNIETLLTDKDLWTRLSNQGRSHIRLLHSPEAVARHFWSLVDGVVAKPEPGE
jgi:glycosyltransferase involved in cell wall biosynthesis